MKWQSRTELLIGKDGIKKLHQSHVLVAGLGGVGSYAAEMLVRAGIGEMTIIDGDKVAESNINRQLPALTSTLEKPKAEVVAARLIDINPKLKLHVLTEYIRDERMIEILKMHPYSYVVDAIDTLSPKMFLIYHSLKVKLNIVCSMGAGGRFDPMQVQIADISKSYNCSLAKLIRKRLHKLGVSKGATVVFSPEKVADDTLMMIDEPNKRSTVGTISYMPAIFGCCCASVVIRDLLK
jgi:tRNA threonylcarbamoyladenosine dehydratase